MTTRNKSAAFILTRPQMGENIGAAARAICNFGFDDLRLVAPRDGWPNDAASRNASGAFDLIPDPPVHESIPGSIVDLHYTYATTARTRDSNKPVLMLHDAIKDAQQRVTSGQQIGFIFGPERTGLENTDLHHANALVHIPTNPAFSSLNLGQSVLLVSYALSQINDLPTIEDAANTPAPQETVQHFLSRLHETLEDKGFYREPDLKERVSTNIRNMFLRFAPSDHDINLLHGILSALTGKKNN